ncbi:DEAD/DEAH box helicase [Bifidobacterium reuteri]|nr:DEAD/DEAH box helicase [Bifidobacterium reuteri]
MLPTHLLPLPPKPGTAKRDSSDGKVPRSSQPAPAKQTPAKSASTQSIQPNVPQTVAASVPAGSTGQTSRPTASPAAAQAPAPAPAIADGVPAGQRDFSGPAHAALKQFFGYDSFVPGQFPVVNSILNGRDVMAAMPAGPDRSLCYQLPATVPHTLTLVIVPSPATVGVEVEHLRRRGIAAALIDGQTDRQESDEIYAAAANRQIRLLYAAPERLLRPDCIDFAKQVRIDMVVVDEAQCVLQENAGFRAEYRNIAGFVHMLPKRPVLAAFADVADPGRCDAIITELGLKDPYRINAGSGQPDTQSHASETASQGNSATADQKKTAAASKPESHKAGAKTEPKASTKTSTKTSKKPRPKRADRLTDKEKAAQAARHAETVKRNEELQARVAMIDGNERAAAERAITGLVGELRAAKGEDPAVSSVTFTLAGEAADFIAAAGLTSNPHFGELKGRFDRDLLRGIVMDMTQRGSLVMENRRLRLPGTDRASGSGPSTTSQA